MQLTSTNFTRASKGRHRPLFGRGSCTDGAAIIEMAAVLPVFILLIMYGVELTYFANTRLQVGQIASSLADNASRIGQTSNTSLNPTVSEQEINSVMFGASNQGQSINFSTNGRAILTSLEKDPATGKQWIHWQRCVGALQRNSSYGNATNNNGLNGPVLAGMGSNSLITADTGKSVMYVEVYYRHTPIFGNMYMNSSTLKQEAAYTVRDSRNLTPGVTGTGGTSTC